MVTITGGCAAVSAPTASDDAASAVAVVPAGQPVFRPVEPGSAEERVVAALVDCLGRWGLQKTTIEDIARASGLSRATVYRLFPGGKQAILEATAMTDLARLVDAVSAGLATAPTLEDSLAAGIAIATDELRSHAAFAYLRANEPEVLEAFLGFDRLDRIFATAAVLVAPHLERFVSHQEAVELGVWGARVVLSYLTTPAEGLDLSRPADARRLVTTYVLPGLPAASVGTSEQSVQSEQ